MFFDEAHQTDPNKPPYHPVPQVLQLPTNSKSAQLLPWGPSGPFALADDGLFIALSVNASKILWSAISAFFFGKPHEGAQSFLLRSKV